MRQIKEEKAVRVIAFHPTLHQVIFGGSGENIKSLDLTREDTTPEEIGTTNKTIFGLVLSNDCKKIYCSEEKSKTL